MLLVIYSRELKIMSTKNIYTEIFTAVIISKLGSNQDVISIR